MPEVTKEKTQIKKANKLLLEWSAPARPFKRRTRDFYVTILALAALFGLILFLIDGAMPVVLIIALLFLFYVMSTIEPETVAYKITEEGIKIGEDMNPWELFGRFWFSNRFGSDLLVIESTNLGGRTEIVLTKAIKPQVEETLSKYLVYEEVPASLIDKASNWFSKRVISS